VPGDPWARGDRFVFMDYVGPLLDCFYGGWSDGEPVALSIIRHIYVFDVSLDILPDNSREGLFSMIRTLCPLRQHSRLAISPATPAPTIKTEIPVGLDLSGAFPCKELLLGV